MTERVDQKQIERMVRSAREAMTVNGAGAMREGQPTRSPYHQDDKHLRQTKVLHGPPGQPDYVVPVYPTLDDIRAVAKAASMPDPGKLIENVIALMPQPRTVLCHGVFDVLHLGHVRYLEAAKALGDRLVVSVTSDEHAAKAPGRPVHTQAERMDMLRSLACVDQVVASNHPTAAEVIMQVQPHVYAKGIEYLAGGLDQREIDAATKYGAIHYIDTPTMSSSAIINRSVVEPAVAEYLDRARALGWAKLVPDLIDRIAKLRVLFIGESIVDRYIYTEPLIGKPSKESIIAVHQLTEEKFDGGVDAAASHLESFCSLVDVHSQLCVHKVRYVDRDTNRKMFEVYVDGTSWTTNDPPINPDDYDLVIVTDFGHGMMADRTRLSIIGSARYLAVNTQTNAGNHGFNLITKYPNADYACIDLPEARLAVGDPDMSAEDCARVLTNRMPIGRIAVTHGRHGSVVLDKRGWDHPDPHRVPAVGANVIDTMGAGDAYLAVTAPLMSIAKPEEVECVAFVGNVVGAIKCQILGHREPVTKDRVLAYCATLLK